MVTAGPSPYADRIARVPVRVREVTLRGAVSPVRTYGPAAPGAGWCSCTGCAATTTGWSRSSRTSTGVRVLVPDLPGFGGSAPLPRDRHDVAGYAGLDARRCWPPSRRTGTRCWPGTRSARSWPRRRWPAGAPVRGLVLVNPIATSALAGPRRVATRATVLLPPAGRRAARAGRHRAAAQPDDHPAGQRRPWCRPRGPGAAALDPRRARPAVQRVRRPPGAAGGVRRLGRRRRRPSSAARVSGADAAGGRRAGRHRAGGRPARRWPPGSRTRGWWCCRAPGTSPTTRRRPRWPRRSPSSAAGACEDPLRLPVRPGRPARRDQPVHRSAWSPRWPGCTRSTHAGQRPGASSRSCPTCPTTW